MRLALALAGGLLSTVLTACGGPRTPTQPPSHAPSVNSPAPAPLGSPPLGSPRPTEPLNGPSSAPTGVDPDPSLLDLVPAAAAGASVTYDPETTASVAADPTLAKDVSYLAIGLARANGAAPDAPDFAIVNVARPRDQNAVDEDWFRDWRDSYDASACAQAGGVARNATFQVSGLAVFTASCANGAFTYHALIADGGIVLSITSIGPANLGRTIVEKLHP